MKKIIALIGLVALMGITVQAQSSSVPNLITNGQTFLQSAAGYFTDFNTNYTWQGIKIELSAGYAQVAGVNAAEKVDGQFDFGSSSQFAIEGTVQFSGIGSAINGGELGFEYAVIQHYDTKVEVGLIGGYDDTIENTKGERVGSEVIEPEISIKKKLTTNTFAGTKLSLPIRFIGKFNSDPTIYVMAGFTF